MIRRLAAAILLVHAAALARADPAPVMRIGVLPFETADAAVDGAAASDLFSTSLYRNFPGISVTARSELEAAIAGERHRPAGGGVDKETATLLQGVLGLDSAVLGNVLAVEKDPDGDGGSLMMSARLVKLATGEILWADTLTARLSPPLLKRIWRAPPRSFDAAAAGKLLELAVFQLVQDLGKRLPEEALAPAGAGAVAERKDAEPSGCSPPAFYRALPRDRDWYYGAGRDEDAGKARDAALAALSRQATGGSGGGIAGWEQDDYRRCGGFSYVLVRIERDRVRKLVAANPPPARAEAPSFTDKVPSKRALEEIARANAARSAEIYADLAGPRKSGAPSREDADLIAETRRKLAAGTLTAAEVVRVGAIYARHSDPAAERDFLDAVIYRKIPVPSSLSEDYALTRELVFPLAWNAAAARKDWQGFFKYCGDYLRSYPNGYYAATAQKNRENAAEILMVQNGGVPDGQD